ncbi:hypothetical protein [Desulfatitalea tepidiphila]|uniref:hypothetical protein n=1 Tax=Desulfatitalea tepidiphila TaxID=1185843 RepID=UPI0006B63BBC|nr:hypothetical protein [Desulfatitalea tepidiphila]
MLLTSLALYVDCTVKVSKANCIEAAMDLFSLQVPSVEKRLKDLRQNVDCLHDGVDFLFSEDIEQIIENDPDAIITTSIFLSGDSISVPKEGYTQS